jgi:hypothetical protein
MRNIFRILFYLKKGILKKMGNLLLWLVLLLMASLLSLIPNFILVLPYGILSDVQKEKQRVKRN